MLEQIKNGITDLTETFSVARHMLTKTRPPERQTIEAYMAIVKQMIERGAQESEYKVTWGELFVSIGSTNYMIPPGSPRFRQNINTVSTSELGFVLEKENSSDSLKRGKIRVENSIVKCAVEFEIDEDSGGSRSERGPLDLLMTMQKRWDEHLKLIDSFAKLITLDDAELTNAIRRVSFPNNKNRPG